MSGLSREIMHEVLNPPPILEWRDVVAKARRGDMESVDQLKSLPLEEQLDLIALYGWYTQ